jgi:hypothetical protein
MRHLTVTGTPTAAFIAATHSPTSTGSAIRQAPKRPSCTRSEGTADIEVDLVIAEILADPRRGSERCRISAAKLQRDRMLARRKAKQPRAIAMQHCAGGEHLGVQQRPPGQQPMHDAAMPVGPVHHRSDGKLASSANHLRVRRERS